MKKRTLFTILLLFILLSGCTKANQQPAVTGTPSATATVAPVSTEEPVSTPSDTPTVAPTDTPVPTEEVKFIDFVASLSLDMTTDTKKQEVTVKTFVDGDTVHFNVPESVDPSGVLKARFIAINTPESTGKIEEYGKAASRFTKEKLSSASSILIESDDSNWNIDSTGGRFLVWIWYKPDSSSEYRNLNVEILQNGLAIASSTANNRYGTVATNALNNAKACKLNIFSGQKDPDFFYGDAMELTLKELRLNIADYNGSKVAFEGVVTVNSNSSVYVEEFDPETGLYFGISVYYGYNLSGGGLSILNVGNRVRIVGSCQYYEAGGTWQISDVSYRQMKPNDPGNIQKISEGNEAAFVLTSPKNFAYGKVVVETDDGVKEYAYAELILGTTVTMENLDVVGIYTTTSDASSSKGAMTLTCKAQDGTQISVRTAVLYDDDKNLVTEDKYKDRNITVKGIVEYFDGGYQIKVLSDKHITINH